MTNAERLARIETLLDEKIATELERMGRDITEIKQDVTKERAARLAMENKGKGALAVASLVFTSIGAFVTAFWDQIKGLFH